MLTNSIKSHYQTPMGSIAKSTTSGKQEALYSMVSVTLVRSLMMSVFK